LPEAARNLFDIVRVRILGECIVAEKITVERHEAAIEFPRESMSRERALEIAQRSQDFPVELSVSGPLVLKLPLGMYDNWRDKLVYVLSYLGSVAGVDMRETSAV
jgi:hypothetical protein